jgi:dTDP-glucose 4,6-dehydratase
MSNLLITGGAGFIGANFVNYRLAAHPDDKIVVLDALTYAGNMANLASAKGYPGFHFVHGSINDEELVIQLLKEHCLDTIVNFAAESHVDRSIQGPDLFVETNIVGTHTLLKAARKVWLDESYSGRPHRFHHVSTDEVYGSLGKHEPPFSETTPYAPNSPYSASKASSDHLVRSYHHTYGLQVTTSCCSNNYGPFQFPEKLIPLVFVNILTGTSIPVYGDGLNIRDWLYVEDHCRGIDLVLAQGSPGEVYNLGGNNEWANIDIIRLICRMLDERFADSEDPAARYPDAPPAKGKKAESLITFVTDRPGHDRRYAIDAGKSRIEIGYEPAESFHSGISRTIDWYFKNEAWWREVSSFKF